jgi:glutathione S-transferase
MKLRYSPTSPYVRKVVVTALELGIDGRIERIATNTADPASGLAADNPLAKVPALLTDDIGPLYDSPVICEYLDSLQGAPKLHPAAGPARWVALRRQALADGMTDAAILRRLEEMRPAGEQSPSWIVKQQAKVEAGLDALEREAAGFAKDPGIDQIAVGCALGYLDFRYAADRWRDRRPALARWFDAFARRPSMAATAPKG